MKPYLADAAKTKEVLERFGFFVKKGYGQNFLIEARIPEGIAEAAGLTKADTVFEIGPGIGTLTQYLAERAGRVIALELDKKLEPVLAQTLAGWDNITLLWGDVMKQDLPALFAENGVAAPVKVVANLPYYITTPILMRLLEHPELFSELTLMVQQEVGERMAAAPGGKDYGALSVSVQYFARPRMVLPVPPSSFWPQPKVHSAVVQLSAGDPPQPAPLDKDYFFSVVKAAFLQRRKMLPNALAAYPPLGIRREAAEAALREMGLDEKIRGERLSLTQFLELSNILWKAGKKASGKESV